MADLWLHGADFSIYRERFLAENFVAIDGFLDRSAAARLFRLLEKDTPWELVSFDGGRFSALPLREVEQELHERRAVIDWTGSDRASFQFRYCRYPVTAAQRTTFDQEITDLFCCDAFVRFVRQLTGDPSILRADVTASYYPPGSFLTVHDDSDPRRCRRYAYVLYLAPEWRPEWGGVLELLTHDEGTVMRAIEPAFNRLGVFRVPWPHRVTQVSKVAVANRYALHGWCMAAEPNLPVGAVGTDTEEGR